MHYEIMTNEERLAEAVQILMEAGESVTEERIADMIAAGYEFEALLGINCPPRAN